MKLAAVGVLLAFVSLALGVVIWAAALRGPTRLRPWVTSSTVPCCPAGVSGYGGGAQP